MSRPLKIATIGVYGFTEESFLAALRSAGVDTVCDIRRRRGVRGREYAFANAARLQEALAASGIRYVHILDLAPTDEVRQIQLKEDKARKMGQRSREAVGEAFKEAFAQQVLSRFRPEDLFEHIPADAQVICFLCVEREPEACHRSLVAERLGRELNAEVTHLRP